MSAQISFYPLTARRNKENVQRMQITFPSVKASLSSAHVTITRFARPAPFFLKAACSTLDLVRATCQYSSLSVFSASRGIPRGGKEEGINISRELITAFGRYKVYSREEGSRKVLRNCNTTCEVFARWGTWDSLRMRFICRASRFARAETEPRGRMEILLGRLFIAANLFRNSPRNIFNYI